MVASATLLSAAPPRCPTHCRCWRWAGMGSRVRKRVRRKRRWAGSGRGGAGRCGSDAMTDLLMRLMQLNAEYAAVLDEDRLEAWPDFFVADCLYKITSADNVRVGNEAGIVYADSRAMLADRVLALRRANIYERQSY